MRLAREPDDPERPVFSEYHAAGAVSGTFMLLRGRWKHRHYAGFPPELFDIASDPEETRNLAQDLAFAAMLYTMGHARRSIVDPEATDAQAFADQEALIRRHGGREAELKLGAPGITPPVGTWP